MRIETGVAGLDERLGGGLPSGSLVLLLSNSETCLRLFQQQALFHIALAGRRVFYLTVIKDPEYIRDEMVLYGWDVKNFESKNLWLFVDAYTQKVDSLMMAPQAGPKFDLMVLIRRAILSQLKDGDVILFDSLSDILLMQSTLPTIELLEIVSSQVRKTKGIVFLPVFMEMHDKKTLAIISHIADVVVDLELGKMQFEGKMRFWKMRGVRAEPLSLPFSITDRGLMADTFTHVV